MIFGQQKYLPGGQGSVGGIIFHSQCSAGLLFRFVLHAFFSSKKCLQEIANFSKFPPSREMVCLYKASYKFSQVIMLQYM